MNLMAVPGVLHKFHAIEGLIIESICLCTLWNLQDLGHCGNTPTFHHLILQKLWAINYYVLICDEIVFIECSLLAPFLSKLELHRVRFRL